MKRLACNEKAKVEKEEISATGRMNKTRRRREIFGNNVTEIE